MCPSVSSIRQKTFVKTTLCPSSMTDPCMTLGIMQNSYKSLVFACGLTLEKKTHNFWLFFFVRVHQRERDSPEPSCVSMKSNRSMIPPFSFKDGHNPADKMQEFSFLFSNLKHIPWYLPLFVYFVRAFFVNRPFQENQTVMSTQSAQDHTTDLASTFSVCDKIYKQNQNLLSHSLGRSEGSGSTQPFQGTTPTSGGRKEKQNRTLPTNRT